MTNLAKWLLWIFLVTICLSGTRSDVTVSPHANTVLEDDNATVRCMYNGNNSLQGVTFYLGQAAIATIFLPNCTHNVLGFDNYITTCEGNKTIVLILVNVSRNDHGKTLTCKVFLNNAPPIQSSSSTLLTVNVPVTKVTITTNNAVDGVISLCKGTSLSFKCKTSAGRPPPNITWVLQSNFSAGENTSVSNVILETDESQLDIASSTFNVTANRLLNNWSIFCLARNILKEEVNSSNIYFNILYPPVQSPSILDLNITNSISIIEGRHGVMTCAVPVSNPVASLSWEGYDYRQEIKNNTVTNKFEWMASRNDTNLSTCIAKHDCDNYEMSISVMIKVLYPPTVKLTRHISIIEGSMLNITCNVTLGIPKVATFKWTRRTDSFIKESQLLMIENITRNSASTYTCTVVNTMKPTIGNEEKGERNGSIEIDVLYPPTIESMNDFNILEGSNFSIQCKVKPGNPNLTQITWSNSDIRLYNVSKMLSFSNVSRYHDRIYTCTVSNLMKPSDGNQVNGTRNESFHLIVEYSSTIHDFFIEGHHQDENVTVNEHEHVTFICSAESNPVSTIEINHPNGTNLKSATLNNVSFPFGPVKCLDAGYYVCSGRNTHNVHYTRQRTELLVTCSPRAHPLIPVKSNITTAQNVRLDMNFSALGYPVPSNFVWQKYREHKWTNVTPNTNIIIRKSGLNFSLTISNTREENFGRYRLIISNNIGEFIQNYTISAEGYPDPPTNFRVLTEEITSSSVTVEWFRSFDGGLPQHFILNVSKTYVELWISETVPDSRETRMSFTISGLSSSTSYMIKLYAENEKGRTKETEIIHFKTADQEEDNQNQSKNIIGVVIGVVFGVIGAVVVIVLIVFILRKRQKKSPEKSIYQNVPIIGKATTSNLKTNKRISMLRETNVDDEDLLEIDDVPRIQDERTEYYNSLDKIGKIDRINVSELFQYVLGKDEDEFAIEYQNIPTELQMTCTFARKPENIALNRYNGIYPYDHSRVKIPSQPDFFMNACYIDGFQRSNAYIASLGPTEKTTQNYVSFWQMVWHERSDIIVMLTNLREPSGMKCEQYWPDEGSMTYGEISVMCVKTEIFAEYTTRRFTLSKINERFTVTQLHYTAWPDKTVPEDVTSLLEFRQRMIATPTTSKGPIIVHCSAGIGRTGTLIAIDRLVAEGRDKHSVNVFECVTSMRKQRVKMVQTLEQYIFIYKALVTALSFDCEVIPVKDFPRHVDGSHSSKYSRQYQQLRLTVEKDKKDEREARERNEKLVNKNRIGADIPGNRFRVFLYLDIEGDENYINAVYINSLKKKDMFIMGQTPLQSTVKDFICMIYQENCICIVTMDDLNESEKTIGKYIFENDKKHAFGNFNISTSILEAKHHYILREMKIKYEGKYDRGEKRVYHFQYKQWLGESDIPNNAAYFVRFVQEIQQYANELGDETSHILVHCMKANERSGIFCAVAIIMEMLQGHDCASVTNTVRRIRTRRRSAITSQEQLLFCYQAGGAFIQQLGR